MKQIAGQTKQIMRTWELRNQKSLGQNFLTDESVLDRIMESASLDRSCYALEIGPGIGALTQRLASSAGKVVAIEVDGRLIPALQENLAEFDNVRIVQEDAMKTDLRGLLEREGPGRPWKAVANLPYYITTPILMRLLEDDLPLSEIVIMVQKEVAERLCADPGSKSYGAITVSVQYRCETSVVVDVPPSSFYPPPKVWSSVVRLTRRKTPPVALENQPFFFRVVKAAFGQRRKTLVNCLTNMGGKTICKEDIKKVLNKLDISENIRGETLGLEQFAQLSNELFVQFYAE